MKLLLHFLAALGLSLAVAPLLAAPAAGQQIYFDASEGGWVDKKANLVWGIDPVLIAGQNGVWDLNLQPSNYAGAAAIAANYPAFCASWGWADYSIVAANWESQGLAWRLPTLKEAQDALSKGLFGKTAWVYPGDRWTSTSGNGKNKNSKWVTTATYGYGYPVDPNAYLAWPLVVRPYR